MSNGVGVRVSSVCMRVCVYVCMCVCMCICMCVCAFMLIHCNYEMFELQYQCPQLVVDDSTCYLVGVVGQDETDISSLVLSKMKEQFKQQVNCVQDNLIESYIILMVSWCEATTCVIKC